MIGQRRRTKLDKGLSSRLRIELDKDLGSRLGIELDIELVIRQLRKVVDFDIKFGSKLETALEVDIKLACAEVRAVGKNIVKSFGAELGAILGSKLGSVLGIALGTELGTTIGLELGASKSKMNISVPTGNRRLLQQEDMIAFVGPSLLSVTSTEAVFDVKVGTAVVDIRLGSKLGTVLSKGRDTVLSSR
jgi:hypothetical protein